MDSHSPRPAGHDRISGPSFPSLPIITPDTPRRSERDKYGGVFYLGAFGLLILGLFVGWFAWRAWSLQGIWTNVYVLHDPHRNEAERVQAAYALSRDPEVNQRQRWDICLRRPLPDLARYVVAESLTAEAPSADPRAYVLAVARSPGWPGWLRLLLTRPLAYAAAEGLNIPVAPLRELRDRSDDPAARLWADFALAASTPADDDAAAALSTAAEHEGPNRELARMLLDALQARGVRRIRRLDDATGWLRRHHPEAARLWSGWRIEGDRLVLVRQPAPKLQ